MSRPITRTVFYRTLNVEGLDIFYREAGPRDGPTVTALARLSIVVSYVPQSHSHSCR